MNIKSILAAAAVTGICHAAESTPDAFLGILVQDQPVEAKVGVIVPPKEIDTYIAKVEASARENMEWFQEYSSKSKPGLPMAYHENLGLTKEEYSEYLDLWKQREFKTIEDVMLLLRKNTGDTWTITATGKASNLSTLRYHAEEDIFRSPNGDLKRIEDIDAEADSTLGEWSGREWKFEEETSLGSTKENFAIGKYSNGLHGLVVYRVQELTATGTRLLDKSLIIRFPLAKATSAKDE